MEYWKDHFAVQRDLETGPKTTDGHLNFYFQHMCDLSITQLLKLIARLGAHNTVQTHQLNSCFTPTYRPKSIRNRCAIEVLMKFWCCQSGY